MLVSDPDVSRPRLIRDARFLEAGRREIALWRGRHNRLGFVYPVAFVRVLGRWKNVILYREIKIDAARSRCATLSVYFCTNLVSTLYTWKVKTQPHANEAVGAIRDHLHRSRYRLDSTAGRKRDLSQGV